MFLPTLMAMGAIKMTVARMVSLSNTNFYKREVMLVWV